MARVGRRSTPRESYSINDLIMREMNQKGLVRTATGRLAQSVADMKEQVLPPHHNKSAEVRTTSNFKKNNSPGSPVNGQKKNNSPGSPVNGQKENNSFGSPVNGQKKNNSPGSPVNGQKKNNSPGSPVNGKKKPNVQPQRCGSASPNSGVVSVKGLSNLGNTCFFNAVIQNLAQTVSLRQILKKVTAEKTSINITPGVSSDLEPIEVQLDQPGSLTRSLCHLLDEMQRSRRDVVTPQGLFTEVCKKAGRFKGSRQQDSQELLRYLLDGVRAEENKRLRSGILEALKKTGDTELLNVYVKNGCPKNFIDEVFGGEMSSTIMCRQCNTATTVTEPFLDLSLPVADEPPKKTEGKAGKGPASTDNDGYTLSKHKQKKARKQSKKTAKNAKIALENRFEILSEEQDGNLPKTEDQDENLAKTDEGLARVSEEMCKLSLDEDVEPDVPPAEPVTVVNQNPELAFKTLAARTSPEKQESSVQACLFRFTEVENLTQTNRLLCHTCTQRRADKNQTSDGSKEQKVYTDSSKQILISAPPNVLTVHLKRSQQVRSGWCKVNKHVEFPQTLDLAPFCAADCKNIPGLARNVLYRLYGVVDHRGSMKAGHYTASVRARPSSNGATAAQGDADAHKGSWFHISDTHVQPVSESKVQSSQAYLLFYERI